MFRDREEIRRRIQAVIEVFRQKGATSPEKALTLQELGLPPRFEQAMHRRLGQTKIFVEVNGKYYLNEERLKEIHEQCSKLGSGDRGDNRRSGQTSWFRPVGFLLMLPIGLIVVLVLFYLFMFNGIGLFPEEFLVLLVIVLALVAVARILFWRARRRNWLSNRNDLQFSTSKSTRFSKGLASFSLDQKTFAPTFLPTQAT